MSKVDQLQLEHNTLMEQYRSTRAEIDSLLAASRQMLSLTFTVISLFLAISAIIEDKFPEAFLIMPFFIYGLVWTQIRQLLLMGRASAYIAQVIAPRVRAIINELSSESTFDTTHILNWEATSQSIMHRRWGWLLLPALSANYGLPIFAALVFLMIYFLSAPVFSPLSWVLIAGNFIAFLYSVTLGVVIEFGRVTLIY